MPPKQQKQNGPAKVKPDLAFGLKNKNKSAKVQRHVQELQQQAAARGVNKEQQEKQKEKERLAARKAAEMKKKEELQQLFQPIDIVQPKVPFGVDPKTVLCAFHKAGRCQKGNKCKYSHDLNQERKAQKASIYADQRDEKKEGEEDDMSTWSEEKLREVVSRKGNPKVTTDIVCKHFLQAVETGKYGWFWECPDGGEKCKYRHALPPGFVLKSQKKKEEDDAKRAEISLEEFLEVERHKLDPTKLTPLTKETFAEWKKNRLNKKDAEAQAVQSAKSATFAAGKSVGMSGRDLFTFNPGMGGDSDEEDEDEDFDVVLLRVRTENERRNEEIERIRQLDAHYGGLHLGDAAQDQEQEQEQQQQGQEQEQAQDPAGDDAGEGKADPS
ncbi:hypothetical protein JCM21900_005261 [Sporobolomyces salmonicolor]